MTLYEYIQKANNDEITVWDKDYDIEVYFYKTDDTTDRWDSSMNELAKLLQVVKESERGVTVNMCDTIESKISNLKDLFINADIDSIMCDMENILAGYVSENWLEKFVNALK